MKKMGSFLWFLCFLPKLWSLNCLKKVHFLQFCTDFSKKYMSIKAIYIHAYERSCYALSENSTFYYAMTYCLKILGFEVREFC